MKAISHQPSAVSTQPTAKSFHALLCPPGAWVLDEEEKKWMNEVEKGNLKSISNLSEKKLELIESTKQNFSKGLRVNIRITDFDLNKLKAKAIEEGIPYQTLIGSILHQYVTGKLVRN